MSYAIAEVSVLILFFGFLALTKYEDVRGVRFFERSRLKLDNTTERIFFVWKRADLADFIRNSVQGVAERIAHDIAKVALYIIQFVEQRLTRVVDTLRTRFTSRAAQSSKKKSPFIQTISDFKQELREKSRVDNDNRTK